MRPASLSSSNSLENRLQRLIRTYLVWGARHAWLLEGPIRRADRETASHDTTPLLFNATTAVRALRNCYPSTLRRPRPLLALLRLPPSSRPLSFRGTGPYRFSLSRFLSRFLSVRCWIYRWMLPKEISKDPSASNIYFRFFFVFNRLSPMPLSKYYSVRHTFVELSRFTGRSLEVRSIRATGMKRGGRGEEENRRDATRASENSLDIDDRATPPRILIPMWKPPSVITRFLHAGAGWAEPAHAFTTGCRWHTTRIYSISVA